MLIADHELDYKWYTTDTASYEAEMERRDKEKEQHFKEHMGIEYSTPPLPTKRELIEIIDTTTTKINNLRKLQVPSELVNQVQTELELFMNSFNKNEFIVTEDEAKYRFYYEDRQRSFKNSFVVNIPEWIQDLLADDYYDDDDDDDDHTTWHAVIYDSNKNYVQGEPWTAYMLDSPKSKYDICYINDDAWQEWQNSLT